MRSNTNDGQRRVNVTYESLPSAETWNKVDPLLSSELPLKNLQWKPVSRPLRVIPAVDLELKALRHNAEEDAAQPASTTLIDILTRPYLHLLFVSCEDNEVYRSTIRAQIRTWLDSVNAKKTHHEWLIIQVTSVKSGPSKFYQRKSTILDKIKADFNTSSKKDRCLQLIVSQEIEEWEKPLNDLLVKIKDFIVAVFDLNVTSYEEDLRKLDSQRTLPGWNFCTFFIQKESLAFSFEAMNLLEDALIQYDELEASFFQSLKESNLVWFGKVGGKAVGDDSASILSTDRKPFRDLIKKNEISIFDFRCYLFARQASLVLRLGRITDLCKRGQTLINSLSSLMRQEQGPESSLISSWIFSVCTELASKVEETLKNEQLNLTKQDVAACQSHLAEFLDLARKQLEQIGMRSGHLPLVHPFIMSAREPPMVVNDHLAALHAEADEQLISPAADVSQQSILRASSDAAFFDSMYAQYCSRCIQAYTDGKKLRMAKLVQIALAAFEKLRDQPEKAQALYSTLSPEYSACVWKALERRILQECLQLQERLKLGREELLSALAFLRAGIDEQRGVWALFAEEQKQTSSSHLVKRISTLAQNFEKDFAAVSFPAFSLIKVADTITRAENQDGMSVACSVANYLPSMFIADEIRMKLVDKSGQTFWFLQSNVSLSPGTSSCELFCISSFSGTLAVDVFQIRISRIIFQYSFKNSQSASKLGLNEFAMYKWHVRVLEDPASLRCYARETLKTQVDEQRYIEVCIHSGKNDIASLALRLRDDGKAATYQYETAYAEPTSTIMKKEKDRVLIESISRETVTKLLIPYFDTSQRPQFDLHLMVETIGSDKLEMTRAYRFRDIMANQVGLIVKSHEYFRNSDIILRFDVYNVSASSISVSQAVLHGNTDVQVESASNASAMSLQAKESVSFLFKLRNERIAIGTKPLQFALHYNTENDTVAFALESKINEALIACRLEYALGSVPALVAYLVKQGLQKSPEKALKALERVLASSDRNLLEIVRQAVRNTADNHAINARVLSMPVEMPSCHIFCRARFGVPDQQLSSIVGQPISCDLTFRCSFQWSVSHKEHLLQYGQRLFFNVLLNPADWTIVGQQKGEFISKEQEIHQTRIHLIPLRIGSLQIPGVSIESLAALDSAQALPFLPSCQLQVENSAQRIEVMPEGPRTSLYWLPEE